MLLPARIFLLCLVSAFLCIWAAKAQTSSIHGRVLDARERPLPSATVQIDGTALGAVSGPDGLYTIPNVPAGEHILVARYIGYSPERLAVHVEAGTELEIDFRLAEDPLGLDELVVSGTFNPATKLESSTAITTLTPRHIEARIPRGSADLLKAVPGLQVTSNYGETGADVTVRGLPIKENSSFRYISLQEDGLPIFEVPGLLFAFPDAMVRQDETIDRVEVVRGGSSAIFASNTPGGIVNFISRTGDPELSGVLKNSVGLQGMERLDVNVGGPLVADWRFNLGGYYRYDEGVRNPGFPANRGGQLKLNLTRTLPSGYIRFYGKYLHEKDVWFMGIPIQNYKDPEAIPGGPAIGSGTTFSSERRMLRVPDAYSYGSWTEKDLDDGYDVRYRSVGLELSSSLSNGWNFTLRSRLLQVENTINLMADVADPFPITAFAQPDLPAQVPRFVRFVNTGETITNPEEVANLNGNGLMSVHGLAFVTQPVSNFIANLQASREIGKHNLNAGLYFSSVRTKLRIAQAGIFLEVANHPRLLQVMIPGQDGNPVGLTPADGFAGYNTSYWNLHTYTNLGALYVGDDWRVSDRLTLDAGLRLDGNVNTGSAERPVDPGEVIGGEVVGQEVPPGYPSFVPTPEQTLWGQFGSGRYRTWDFTFTTLSGSVGINYKLSDQLALYARGSQGNRAPDAQVWTFQSTNGSQITGETVRGEIESILQAEAGVKVQKPGWSLLLTGFYSQSKNLITNLLRGQPDGSFAFLPIPGDTRTIGAEVDAVARPLTGLELRLISTVQDPRFTRFEYQFFIPGDNPHSGIQVRDYSGNLLNEMVRVLSDLTASYTYSRLEVFANFRYTGERMANRPNTIAIPAYNEMMAGAAYTFNRVRVAVQGTNLFNTQAIAQMAARTGEDVVQVHADGTAESVVATGHAAGTTTRSMYTTGLGILPRSILISASYSF